MKKYIEGISLIIMVLASCQKEVVVDMEFQENIIIDGLITDSIGYNYIKVYKTQNYYQPETGKNVTGAMVTVKDNLGKSFVFIENQKKSGYYFNADFFGIAGNTYYLTVEYENVKYESSSYLHPANKLFSINPYRGSLEYIFYDQQNPNDTVKYYRFYLYVNNVLLDGIAWLWITPKYYYNTSYIIHYNFKQWDRITLEEHSLTSEAYGYYQQLEKYILKEENFFSPPLFPKGNISNGGLGIFRASSVVFKHAIKDTTKLRLPWQK